jgi:hypothetical protein
VRLPPIILLNRGDSVCPEYYGPITSENDCGGSGNTNNDGLFKNSLGVQLFEDGKSLYDKLFSTSHGSSGAYAKTNAPTSAANTDADSQLAAPPGCSVTRFDGSGGITGTALQLVWRDPASTTA